MGFSLSISLIHSSSLFLQTKLWMNHWVGIDCGEARGKSTLLKTFIDLFPYQSQRFSAVCCCCLYVNFVKYRFEWWVKWIFSFKFQWKFSECQIFFIRSAHHSRISSSLNTPPCLIPMYRTFPLFYPYSFFKNRNIHATTEREKLDAILVVVLMEGGWTLDSRWKLHNYMRQLHVINGNVHHVIMCYYVEGIRAAYRRW